MPGNFVFKLLLIGLAFLILSISGLANEGKPYPLIHLNHNMMMLRSLRDTLPEKKKENPEAADSKQTTLIKEVPKSRKHKNPIAVPTLVNVKPIKVIKPRIIKPIININ